MKELIWKFDVPIIDASHKGVVRVDLPQSSEVLSCGAVGDRLFIWAKFLSDSRDLDFVPRYFEVFGTGHEITNDMGIERKFIGTAFMHGGSLVWHVFERLD